MPNEKEGKTQYDSELYLWREKRGLLQAPLKGFLAARINPLFVFCGTDVRTGMPFYFTQRSVGPLYDTKNEIHHNDDVPQSYSVPLVSIRSFKSIRYILTDIRLKQESCRRR